MLAPGGRLDAVTSDRLAAQFQTEATSGVTRIAVDMSALDYISSSGLRVFLVALKRVQSASGRLCLAAMRSHVREVFDMAGFSPHFEIFDSVQDAVATLSKQG